MQTQLVKGTLAGNFRALFFLLHKSIVPRPQINTPKYFWIIFCFHGDVHENIFDFRVTVPWRSKKWFWDDPIFLSSNIDFFLSQNSTSNLRVTISGNCSISRYCYPEIGWFPGYATWKLSIARYCYLEVIFFVLHSQFG